MKAVLSLSAQPALAEDDKVTYTGLIFLSGLHTPETGGLAFGIDVPMASTTAEVNAAIKDAALAAVTVQEIDTAQIDEVLIIGGAVLA